MASVMNIGKPPRDMTDPDRQAVTRISQGMMTSRAGTVHVSAQDFVEEKLRSELHFCWIRLAVFVITAVSRRLGQLGCGAASTAALDMVATIPMQTLLILLAIRIT